MVGKTFKKTALMGISVLLGGGVAVSQGGDFFHRLHAPCNQETVTLPAQRVTVETSRPRVVVHERHHAADRVQGPVAVPFVATFYQPMAMPFLGIQGGAVPFAQPQDCARSRVSPFAALHELEAQAIDIAKSRASHEMEVRAAQRIYDRISGMGDMGVSRASTTDCDKAIREEIEKLSKRVDNIEKLIVIHDEVIKKGLPTR